MSIFSIFGGPRPGGNGQVQKAWDSTAKRLHPFEFDEDQARPLVRTFFKNHLFPGEHSFFRFELRQARQWDLSQPTQGKARIPSVSKYGFDTIGHDTAYDPVLFRVAADHLPGILLHTLKHEPIVEVDNNHPVFHIFQLAMPVDIDREECKWHTGQHLGKVLFETTLALADLQLYLDHHDGNQPAARKEFATFCAAILLDQTGRIFKRFRDRVPDRAFLRRWRVAKHSCTPYIAKTDVPV